MKQVVTPRAGKLPMTGVIATLAWSCAVAALVLGSGCASGDEENETRTGPSQRALEDPWKDYIEGSQRDVSGGGLHELDRDAMREDLDDVFNP